MADEWYLARNNQRHGPTPDEEFKKHAALGYIEPDDLVWKEGMSEWQKASTVDGLLPPPTKQGPPPLPTSSVPSPSAPSEPPAKVSGLFGKLREQASVLEQRLRQGNSQVKGAVSTNEKPTGEFVGASPSESKSPPLSLPGIKSLFQKDDAKTEAIAVPKHRAAEREFLAKLHTTFSGLLNELRSNPASAPFASQLKPLEELVLKSACQSENVESALTLALEIHDLQQNLVGHAAEAGKLALDASSAGSISDVRNQDTKSRLEACMKAKADVDELQATMDRLNSATGMLAKVKAKADQAMLWPKIRGAEKTQAKHIEALGVCVLTSQGDAGLTGFSIDAKLPSLAATRSELNSCKDKLSEIVEKLDSGQLDITDNTKLTTELLREIEHQTATQLNACQYLMRVLSEKAATLIEQNGSAEQLLNQMQSLLSEIDALHLESQITELPKWINYKLDNVQQQHVWKGNIESTMSVALNFQRVKKGMAERTYLLVVYTDSGQKMKVQNVPGRIGSGASPLGIRQGESFKLRVGDASLTFKTAGRSKVKKSKHKAGDITTEHVSEEQLYQVTPEQLVRMGTVSETVAFRLEGQRDIEKEFDAEKFSLRIQEWCQIMNVEQQVSRKRFAPPKSSDSRRPPESSRKPEAGSKSAIPTSAAVVAAGAAGLAIGAIAASHSNASEESASEATSIDEKGTSEGMDTDGDGIADTFIIDKDGDGQVDAIGRDEDGDGSIETMLMDADGDGRIDTVGIDSDDNGQVDSYLMDLDGDGQDDAIGIDSDEDGQVDHLLVDTDDDGQVDAMAFDSDGDGSFDSFSELDSDDSEDDFDDEPDDYDDPDDD